MAKSPEYTTWQSMKTRCHNPRAANFHRYGGKGIIVADCWRDDFPAFLAHVGRRPSPGHSIDRHPDTDGDYEPGNVRWATAKQQSANRHVALNFTYLGETDSLCGWAKRVGMLYSTLHLRIQRGVPFERAIQPTAMYREPIRRPI